ncbi:MAG: hypothetical protein ACYTET_00700 [Planctomycetota bacterium]|jgi:hypothetical protein
MKLSDIKNEDKKLWFRRLWIVLIAFLLYQMTSYALRSVTMPRRVSKIVEAYPDRQKEMTTEKKEAGDKKDKNEDIKGKLFSPLPGKPPMPKCTAILGDAALINDKWLTAGKEVNGAKIIEVFPSYVLVTRDGGEHKLVPFDVKVEYNGNHAPVSSKAPEGAEQVSRPPQPEAERRPGGPGRMGPGMGRRGGMEITPEMRERMERYRNASPEEQARMREEYRRERGGRGGRGGGRGRN